MLVSAKLEVGQGEVAFRQLVFHGIGNHPAASVPWDHPHLAMKAGAGHEGRAEKGRQPHGIQEEEILITWGRKSVEPVFKEPLGK